MTDSKSDIFEPQVVLPGDDVTSLLMSLSSTNTSSITTTLTSDGITKLIPKKNVTKNKKQEKIPTPLLKIGNGLMYRAETQTIHCTVAGMLIKASSSSSSSSSSSKKNANHNSTYYVQCNTKRYIPKLNDRVIGIVEEKYGEHYKVNIFGPCPALLPVLAFENATKRNRPYLNVGASLYCRIDRLFDNGSMEPFLSCQVGSKASSSNDNNASNNVVMTDGGANRKDWMTDENTYGELKGGTQIQISLGLARQLLQPHCVVLMALGKHLAFEVAIGVNGVLWVHSTSPKTTVLICNAIQNSEVMTEDQVRGMVRDLVKRIS